MDEPTQRIIAKFLQFIYIYFNKKRSPLLNLRPSTTNSFATEPSLSGI